MIFVIIPGGRLICNNKNDDGMTTVELTKSQIESIIRTLNGLDALAKLFNQNGLDTRTISKMYGRDYDAEKAQMDEIRRIFEDARIRSLT